MSYISFNGMLSFNGPHTYIHTYIYMYIYMFIYMSCCKKLGYTYCSKPKILVILQTYRTRDFSWKYHRLLNDRFEPRWAMSKRSKLQCNLDFHLKRGVHKKQQTLKYKPHLILTLTEIELNVYGVHHLRHPLLLPQRFYILLNKTFRHGLVSLITIKLKVLHFYKGCYLLYRWLSMLGC